MLPRFVPHPRATTRREFLGQAGGGLGAIALASLMAGDGLLRASEDESSRRPLAARPAHERLGRGA